MSFVIFANDGAWKIGVGGETPEVVDVPAGPDVSAAQIASAVAQILKTREYSGAGLTLAIASGWCLCASIDTQDLPKHDRHQAMIYRLEEKLPLSAEDMVADFIPVAGQALGVAAQIRTLSPLVEALEAQGVAIHSVHPTTFMAVQHDLASGKIPPCDAVLRSCGDHLELLILGEAKATSWHLLADMPHDVVVELGVHMVARATPLRLVLQNVSMLVREALGAMPELQLIEAEAEPLEIAATRAGMDIDRGGFQPWVNLRRDVLAVVDAYREIKTPLSVAIAALVLLCLCLIGAMLWRGHKYAALARQYQTDMDNSYAKIFPLKPEQRAPAATVMLDRLEERKEKLDVLAGNSSEVPSPPSALLLMRELLTRIPQDIRYTITYLQLSDEKLLLDGLVKSHADASAIAAALRKDNGFRVDPPPTNSLANDKVGFKITGVPPKINPKTGKAGP